MHDLQGVCIDVTVDRHPFVLADNRVAVPAPVPLPQIVHVRRRHHGVPHSVRADVRCGVPDW